MACGRCGLGCGIPMRHPFAHEPCDDCLNNRDWNKDGRCLNARDARQVVECYHQAYSRARYRWLMIQAASYGRGPEIDQVFRDAIPME